MPDADGGADWMDITRVSFLGEPRPTPVHHSSSTRFTGLRISAAQGQILVSA